MGGWKPMANWHITIIIITKRYSLNEFNEHNVSLVFIELPLERGALWATPRKGDVLVQ
jgi:hypothetical protein